LSDDDAVAGRHYKAAYQRQRAKNAELATLVEVLRNGNRALVERAHAQEREIAQLRQGYASLAEIDAQTRHTQDVMIGRLENALLMIHDRSEDETIRDMAVRAAKSLYGEVESRGC
jgi:hypothetical protein